MNTRMGSFERVVLHEGLIGVATERLRSSGLDLRLIEEGGRAPVLENVRGHKIGGLVLAFVVKQS